MIWGISFDREQYGYLLELSLANNILCSYRTNVELQALLHCVQHLSSSTDDLFSFAKRQRCCLWGFLLCCYKIENMSLRSTNEVIGIGSKILKDNILYFIFRYLRLMCRRLQTLALAETAKELVLFYFYILA